MAILQLMLLLEVRCQTLTLTERATRAWPVYDLKRKIVVFLKDSWHSRTGMRRRSRRSNYSYQGVRISTPWNVGAVVEDLILRGYHRFSEIFIGLHLERFTSSKQFVQAVYDAFIGMH